MCVELDALLGEKFRSVTFCASLWLRPKLQGKDANKLRRGH